MTAEQRPQHSVPATATKTTSLCEDATQNETCRILISTFNPLGILIMALKIRPLEDRVVIQQIEAEEKTAGGIVLPDTAKEKPQRGRVLAVGPGKMLDSGERAAIGV